MNVRETELPGVLVLEPRVFHDERGLFVELFNEARFAERAASGMPSRIRQTNLSRSRRDVLRGLHYQLTQPQGKLISVVRGEIYDVAVDIRPDSPTFRRWTGVHLTEARPCAVWIPPGYAHGFCVLSDVADVVYSCTEVYESSDDRGIRWDDSTLGIDWPVSTPLLSPRDEGLPRLDEASGLLPRFAAGMT